MRILKPDLKEQRLAQMQFYLPFSLGKHFPRISFATQKQKQDNLDKLVVFLQEALSQRPTLKIILKIHITS